MAANRIFRAGPIALTTTNTTNLLNPNTGSGGVNAGSNGQYIVLREILVVNKTSSSATFSLWLGATGANTAGTEIANGVTVAANSYVTMYFPGLRLDTTDFVVGGASAATTLTITFIGDTGIAG